MFHGNRIGHQNETTRIKHGPSTKQIELKTYDAQKSWRDKEEQNQHDAKSEGM